MIAICMTPVLGQFQVSTIKRSAMYMNPLSLYVQGSSFIISVEKKEEGKQELPGLAMLGALLAGCRPSCSAS